jgi:putative zinc finger/helix-turn-helix YgiT family protein
MKAFPHKCSNCRKQSVSPVIEDYSAALEHDGRSYSITVQGLSVLVCSECGERMLDREAGEKVNAALRTAAGLLQPHEIRQYRETLGINQKMLAEHLGIAPATLSRWETGAQIQQRGFDKLLRLYFALPVVRDYLVPKPRPLQRVE